MRAKIIATMGAALLLSITAARALQPVLQRGYDANVSGANLAEVTLNTSNVSRSTFGLVFKLPVDDNIYAQPLYVPGVAIPGQGTHNVVYVATMSDSLYAFDADTGVRLWEVNFASSVGATPVAYAKFAFGGNRNIVGNLGILSTPVIDPSTRILYLVACTLEGGTMVYRLHAVNITNGTEPYTNVVISGSYGGVTFDAPHQTQRASLALSGNHVVFGFAAIEEEGDDVGGYTGWVMAYNKTGLAQSGVFATLTTGTKGGGVWQSGRPPLVDSSGYVYVFTGNGYTNGYDGVHDFSESVLKLNPATGLGLIDWFTPGNWSALDAADYDLSGSGPMLIPGTSLITGGGKAGVLYVLHTANLGKESANDSGAVQELTISGSEIRGGPVYWQRSTSNGGPLLYDWAPFGWVKAYAFNGSRFATSPSSQSSGTQNWPGGILALSANGDTPGTGVLWATVATSSNAENDPPVTGELHAFDADNVSTELWNSAMNSARDNFGNFAKFVPPLVVNGKVYVATQSDQVAVYGLLTAAPTFSPAPGSYASAQSVTLSDTTPGAVIHYTTNGTTPTTSSAKYSAPIVVGSTQTIQAMAVASGDANSAVASGSYVIATGGGSSSVKLSAVANVDGIAKNGSAAIDGGWDNSGYAYSATLLGTSITHGGATYTLGAPGTADAVSDTTIPLPAGNYIALSLLGSAVNGKQANQRFVVTYTDGTTTTFTQSLSDWWGPPQNFTGESLVLKAPYLITPTGATLSYPVYVYGYTFALNSAKTVKSLRLPANRNVVILAVDVTSAAAIGIKFMGQGTAMGSTEIAGVVAQSHWNNATGTSSTAPLVLANQTGASSGATVTWSTNGIFKLPITDTAGNDRMMRGYLDPVGSTTKVTVAGLPANAGGYHVYVYADGDNGSATRTGAYQISGTGITTTRVNLTDAANTNFRGTFTQANNSTGDYVMFTITAAATGFMITATPGASTDAYSRAPLNAIQIIPN